MSKNAIKGRVLVILSTIIMCAIGILTYVLYNITNYTMYLYIHITSALFGGTSLLLILLRYRRKKPVKSKIRFIKGYPRIFKVIAIVVYGCLILYSSRTLITLFANKDTLIHPEKFNIVVFLLLFVVLLVLEKLCEHSNGNTSYVCTMLENSRTFMKFLSVEVMIATVCAVIESLKLLLIQKYVGYCLVVFVFYYMVCILLSIIVVATRQELNTDPYMNVPIPFARWIHGNKTTENRRTTSFIDYLEENTGISMRSLWSVKYIRQIAPFVVLISGMFLWLSTCVVQVEPYQQAAVYRIGRLKNELLQPGLHLTLPYPIDKVEIYDTEVINKTTIGFRAEESTNNIWTTSHQGDEYKLLLGSGDEVVSINLRLEYKISNLKQYLRNSRTPEAIIEAFSYELVTEQTIHTDLTTLLSSDREAFSKSFQKKLSSMVEKKKIGLEVVSVVLESIHPPKEIASVYQETVSAEIRAEQYIIQAQAAATVKLMEAQKEYDSDVNAAYSDDAEAISEAKYNIAEFLAGVEAANVDEDSYRYQKYLEAVRKAYGNAKLVIVGEGIDQSALFFGDITNPSNEKKDSPDNNVVED